MGPVYGISHPMTVRDTIKIAISNFFINYLHSYFSYFIGDADAASQCVIVTAVRLTLRSTNSAFQFVSQLNIIQKP